MTSRACQAKNPATCPHHSTPALVTAALCASVEKLEGHIIPRTGRTVSGHAIGSRVEEVAYEQLQKDFAGFASAPEEFMTALMEAHPEAATGKERALLYSSDFRRIAFGRSAALLGRWTPGTEMPTKQDDTADIVLSTLSSLKGIKNEPLYVLDVKSTQSTDGHQTRPPNIISGRKVFNMMKSLFTETDNRDGIFYIHTPWEFNPANSNEILFLKPSVIDLFKVPPTDLRVNFSAGSQLQFDPHTVSQTYTGTKTEWAREYLLHYVELRQKHNEKQAIEIGNDAAWLQENIIKSDDNT